MKNILLFAIAFLSLYLSGHAQTRYYVNHSATGANNGQSWADAFTDLQSALQLAQTDDEVWVAEGTYLPASDAKRDTSFQLQSGAKLYGGFAGIETDLNQRDWEAHPTILSGDIGLPGDSTDNSYTILFLDNPDSLTVVDGFVFRFGNAGYPTNEVLPTSSFRSGGALYIMADWEAFALISHCRFEYNSARNHGGAVFVNGQGGYATAPTFRDCIFEHNDAGQDGGGLLRLGNSDIERMDFEGCTFRENRAGRSGGGLYYQDANTDNRIELADCIFFKNQAANLGAAAVLRIGRTDGAFALIKGCRFEENIAPVTTAALTLFHYNFLPIQDMVIEKCFFARNPHIDIRYDFLGTDSSTMTIRESRFEDHFSTASVVSGEVISNQIFEKDTFVNIQNTGQVLITQGEKKTIFERCVIKNIMKFGSFNRDSCLFANCLITNSIISSGIVITGKVGSPIQFANCSFVNCKFNYLVFPASTVDGVGADFYNCLFANSSVTYSEIATTQTFVTINNSHLPDTTFCMPTSSSYYVTCGPNNLFNLDPMFRDTAAGDYSLLPCSPLINAGSNAAAAGILTDIAGSPRILEGTVDIGAYEAPAFALASPPQVGPACAGDANGSISVSPAFGCEPYAYQWLPAAGNGPELDGLSPGNYLLTLTDGSGRQILDTITVGIAPQPSVALAATDVPCGSTLGGTLSASVSSGTPPFHYTWNPAGADTSFLAQLSPLDYQLSVTDANGCLGTASASIGLQGLLTLMVDGALVSCHGASDGWLSATPVTGAAPFHWLWDGWPGTDSIAQPLAPGLYAVTVSDAYGCTAAFAFPPMTEPQALSATAGTEPQTDAAMPNGVAIVTTTSGGTMPYGYAWSTGEMGQFITGLEAGTYTVTVTDAHGCTASLEVTVELMVGTGGPALRALLIFPNPSADWAEIVLPENFPAHNLELTDASGRVVKALAVAPQTGAYRLNLSELPGGEYLVTLRGKQASELMTGKILKR